MTLLSCARMRLILIGVLLLPCTGSAQVQLPDRPCHAQYAPGTILPWRESGFRQYDPGVFVSTRSLALGLGWMPATNCDGFRVVMLAELKLGQ